MLAARRTRCTCLHRHTGTKTSRTRLVLFGMHGMTFGPHRTAIKRMLVSVMRRQAHERVMAPAHEPSPKPSQANQSSSIAKRGDGVMIRGQISPRMLCICAKTLASGTRAFAIITMPNRTNCILLVPGCCMYMGHMQLGITAPERFAHAKVFTQRRQSV
jgi:hypothetical protein